MRFRTKTLIRCWWSCVVFVFTYYIYYAKTTQLNPKQISVLVLHLIFLCLIDDLRKSRGLHSVRAFHGSPVSAISHSLGDWLTPIALSLTPGLAWHSGVASGTGGNWTFFVITCACRSCSILWQFQSHAVAKPRFFTAWMLVCLLVQSLLC